MKKVSVFLFTAILAIAFMACEGAKKTETPAVQPVKTDTIAKVVAPQPAAPDSIATKSPADMLKDFQAYAKAYGEAFNSITKNPSKFSELSSQSKKRVTDMEQIKSKLNQRQLQDYQKSLAIIRKVNEVGK